MTLPAKYWLIIFLILGILYKLWFVGLQPQPFAFDQEEYHAVALDLLGKRENMFFSAYRVWGYPLILSAVYSIFGTGDTLWWKVVQAGLDSLTGVLVFLIAKELFKNKKIAWLSASSYILNPYTSAYVGVRLTEITAIFLVAAIFYLFLKFMKTKLPAYLFLLAVFLGFLPFVRPGYLYFSIFTMIILIIKAVSYTAKTKAKIFLVTVISFTFFSFFIFNIARNYLYFKQVAILTVDSLFVREFYISLFIDSFEKNKNIPKQVTAIYQEYSRATTASERKKMAQKYSNLAKEEIYRDPVLFIVRRIRKLWIVWEKHELFSYENLKNDSVTQLVYWSNIIIFMVSAVGISLWVRKKKEVWFALFFFFLVTYITVLHAFTITAERFSLPAYPLIILFAGYGLWTILTRLSNIFTHQKKENI